MRKLCMSVMVLVAICCSGCSSGLVGTLPVVNDVNDASEIYIIRGYNYVSSGVSAYVSFDDKDVLAIRTVEHTKFTAPSGKHTLGVRNPGLPTNNIAISLTPKNRYYFRVSVGVNFSLVPMPEEEALTYLSTTHYVPLAKDEKSSPP